MKMIPMAMILAALMSGPEPKPAGTVLFVCEHGSAKSVVAAAHFNRIAAERGLPFRAISRGTVPDPEMAPAAVKGLLGDGLKPADPAPAKLTQSDLDTAAGSSRSAISRRTSRRPRPSNAGRCLPSAPSTPDPEMPCLSEWNNFCWSCGRDAHGEPRGASPGEAWAFDL